MHVGSVDASCMTIQSGLTRVMNLIRHPKKSNFDLNFVLDVYYLCIIFLHPNFQVVSENINLKVGYIVKHFH